MFKYILLLLLPQPNRALYRICYEIIKIGELINHPIGPFTILQPDDQEIGEFRAVQKRRATDFEAPELWKGPLGNYVHKCTHLWAFSTCRRNRSGTPRPRRPWAWTGAWSSWTGGRRTWWSRRKDASSSFPLRLDLEQEKNKSHESQVKTHLRTRFDKSAVIHLPRNY